MGFYLKKKKIGLIQIYDSGVIPQILAQEKKRK